MKAGIAIDPWKRPYFERELEAAGFTWCELETGVGVLAVLLHVEFEREQTDKLKETVARAQLAAEAARPGTRH